MSFRVIRLYDIKNEQRESSAAHVGSVSQTVRSGNGPYKEKHHARPIFSRFSPSHNLITQQRYRAFMTSRIWKCILKKMHTSIKKSALGNLQERIGEVDFE
jgi:hypothetical protein